MKSDKEIEELVEKLFRNCVFDPAYMSESFAKERLERHWLLLMMRDMHILKRKWRMRNVYLA